MSMSKTAANHVETIKHRAAIKKLVFKGSWGSRERTETGWKREDSGTDAVCEVHYNDGTLQTHTYDSGISVERDGDDYLFDTEGTVTKPD